MSDDEAAHLEKCLVELAACEQEMDLAEKDAEVYRINKTQKIYESRREILKRIPQFWYIVLAENDDFAEYLAPEDLQYLETITDVYVRHKVVDSGDIKHYRDFSITISFEDKASKEHPIISTQEVIKHFTTMLAEGEEKLVSEPVLVEWPQELASINPKEIKKLADGSDLSKEQKKNYRAGMRSLFAWFDWTGAKPGKEFRSGDDLARLILDNIFPYAVKYYTEALPNDDDDEFDSSEEGEELDISDDEEAGEDEQPGPKRQKTVK